MPNTEPPDLITTGVAARLLNVSENTVRKYDEQGRLQSIRTGSMRLFDREQVKQLAAARLKGRMR